LNERPYWWDSLPAYGVRVTPAAEMPDQADVAVVGAGYTGLTAARRLARAGASVVVLERERVGFGASSRNGGQVLTGLKLDPAALIARYGQSRARQLYDAADESIATLEQLIAAESIDCEYERSGHVQAAAKPSHFAAFREEQALLARVFQHRVALVSRDDQRAEVGTDRYHGLLVDERSGALNPAQLVHGLAASAARAGARIFEGVAVDAIAPRGKAWTISSGRRSLEARDVMIATNAYGGLETGPLRNRFVPIGSYMIATEPLTNAQCDALLPRRRMAFDSRYFLFYFRLTNDRRLLFGGRAEFTQPTDSSVRRAAGILRAGMVSVFPELSEAQIDYAWGGRVAFTRDQMPHAGRLDSGVYFAGGYCGHGIAMATLLGDLVGRRIAGEAVAHPLVDDGCPAIPFYSGTPWFLPLAGAYYRVKDWIS
jgi:glycine/D-amino acid oxidase-like deaminating enzyme